MTHLKSQQYLHTLLLLFPPLCLCLIISSAVQLIAIPLLYLPKPSMMRPPKKHIWLKSRLPPNLRISREVITTLQSSGSPSFFLNQEEEEVHLQEGSSPSDTNTRQ
jgi:hypothetical protein